ncbi:MAG: hypothetical protein CSA58_08590 [Micrococcales bacterium]|nr:MAG: hypothetical protein CSB46_00855 [Micrococcales bacterium]PIE26613.1 MAG: hypothetical protein CSA58_08590 [Micrococcales bacterium]
MPDAEERNSENHNIVEQGPAKDVFISYGRADTIVAEALLDHLESHDIRCWMAPRDVVPGMEYAKNIYEAINSARVVVLVMSSASISSQNVLSETNIAFQSDHVIIIPFKISEIEPNESWQYYVGVRQWIDAFPNVEDHFEELALRIQGLLDEKSDSEARRLAHNDVVARFNFHKLRKKYDETRLSLGLSLSADPAWVDRAHRYLRVRRIDVMNILQDGVRSYRWLTVRNESSNPTYHLDHQESGENKVSFDGLGVICADSIDTTERNRVSSETRIQPNFVQVIRLYFSKALEPGEETTLFFKLDWPGEVSTYWDQELSQSISFTRYALGVEELDFSVYDTRRVIDAHMTEISPLFEESRSPRPGRLQLIDQEPDLARLHGNNIGGARFTVSDPTGAAYRIIYRLESDTSPTVPDLF